MITLPKLNEYIPNSMIDLLESENLFERLMKEVKREMAAFGITITSEYVLPEALYRPVAYMFTYLAAMKNLEGISKEMITTFNNNYSVACSQIKAYAVNNVVSDAVITNTGANFTNSEYYLR